MIFSTKRIKPDHPPLNLGDDVISQTLEHKHLGMVLDSKLDFKSHLREAIVKARRGIGMMKHLSRYVSRDVLIQLYKLYVRPHLDYGDIIYHKYDPSMRLDFTNKLEQSQYAAALAATGAWKGTSRDRFYQELGWETLYDRRWFRRLCHFFNVRKLQSPSYLFSEIPPVRPVLHNLRHSRTYDQSAARTTRFSNTYFYNTLFEWNSLNEELKNSSTLAEFNRKLITRVRPEGNLNVVSNLAPLMNTNFGIISIVLTLFVIVAWLKRIMSTSSCTAHILMNCVRISSVSSLEY